MRPLAQRQHERGRRGRVEDEVERQREVVERIAPATSDLGSPNCQTDRPNAVASVSSATATDMLRPVLRGSRPASNVRHVPAVSAISGETPP